MDPLRFWLPLHRTSRLCHLSEIFFFHTTLHQCPLEDLHRNAALKIMGSLKKKKDTTKSYTKNLLYIFLINYFYIFLHFWHMRDHEPYQSPRRPFAGFQPVRGGSLLPTMLPTYRVATFTNIDSPKSGERFRKCGGANGLRFLGTKFLYLGFPYKTHPKPATVHLFPPMFLVLVGFCLLHGSLKNKACQILFKVHPPRRVLSGI